MSFNVKFPPPFTLHSRISRVHRCLSPSPSRQIFRGLATVHDTNIFSNPSRKYKPYAPILLNDRQWPTKVLHNAPMWLSTDLRDGNQALPNPMNLQQKLKFFEMLVKIGFKEIEVAYPSASQTEFMFVRSLIEHSLVPDDVWIQVNDLVPSFHYHAKSEIAKVLTPCRPELIKRTLESVAGAKNVIIHTYFGTARIFREVVYQKTCAEAIEMAMKNVAIVRDLTQEYAERYGTNFRFNFGVEGFSQAEPEFVLKLCEQVKRTWGRAGSGNQRITFNLAASVEVAPPNHFADQVESFSRNISEREKVIISLHPHNDMGTATAAAQLGLLAGAERVEGCLLGHGERTGNVDLITMALNQFTQGISAHLDFSNLPAMLNVIKECTNLPVNPRLPYSGELAFTAFSGSHQDAIQKGFQEQKRRHDKNRLKEEPELWSIPYLPFDPTDIGCSYEAMIRVNSQSGKAGVASLLDQALSIKLPREMQAEFYKVVQKETERTGKEVSIQTIVRLFRQTYRLETSQRPLPGYVTLHSYRIIDNGVPTAIDIEADIECGGLRRTIRGSGSTSQAAFLSGLSHSLGLPMTHLECQEQRGLETKPRSSSKVASFAKISHLKQTFWGVGVAANERPDDAGIYAIISAVNQFPQFSFESIKYPSVDNSTDISPRGQKLKMSRLA